MLGGWARLLFVASASSRRLTAVVGVCSELIALLSEGESQRTVVDCRAGVMKFGLGIVAVLLETDWAQCKRAFMSCREKVLE